MVIKHDKHFTDVDSWAEIAEDDYCYECSKWIEATQDDCCPICESKLDYSDKWDSAETAKVATSDAPKINSYTGDIWNRGKSYVWGGGSWWNSGNTTHTGSTVSSMWGSWGGSSSQSQSDAARMLKHKRHLDSLCKVVDPTVSHVLDYSSGRSSYSDMRLGRIYIDGTMLKDSDDNLDITAGLAIHEKLHLIHSKPLIQWEKDYRYKNDLSQMEGKLLHSIANSIEDEYIEKQLGKSNAGFVTYIEAVKKHYFDTKMEGRLEDDDDTPFIDILNTLLAFIRWPNNLSAERKKKHAKHIQFFARALAKGLDSRDDTYHCISVIYQYLRKVAEAMAKDDDSLEDKINEKMESMREEMGDEGLTEGDWDKIEEAVTRDMTRRDARAEALSKILSHSDIDGLTKIVDWSADAQDSPLSKQFTSKLKDLEDSDFSEEKLKDVALIYHNAKKVTWRRAMPTARDKERYTQESKLMKKVTTQLKRKIDLYGNTQTHIIRNQKRGKIDKRMLHRIPVGRQDLFKVDIQQDDKPLDVCILVDESGSMGYDKMDMARQSTIAIKEALHDNPKLNLWVYGHTADGHDEWHSDKLSTNLTEYWSPTMKDRPMALGSMQARYENRDGTAIHAASLRVKKESQQPMSNKLMIVISDGQPAAYGYGGMDGRAHVKKVVKHLESQGWSVIQVGIRGADTYAQAEMFSNHIFVDKLYDLAPKIGKIIRKVIKV
jgi:Mg-chelatase subunit ChlD